MLWEVIASITSVNEYNHRVSILTTVSTTPVTALSSHNSFNNPSHYCLKQSLTTMSKRTTTISNTHTHIKPLNIFGLMFIPFIIDIMFCMPPICFSI